jgi:hypothetical protein
MNGFGQTASPDGASSSVARVQVAPRQAQLESHLPFSAAQLFVFCPGGLNYFKHVTGQ